MRQPLYALLISPDEEYRSKIVSREITATVREGYRDYREGRVVLCCHLEPWVVLAEITEVRHLPVRAIPEREAQACGFKDAKELLSNLRKFYSDIGMSSAVTFIRWDNIQGKLIGGEK